MMITVERVDAGTVLGLRAAILRPGLPAGQAAYAQDEDPRTVHLAAFDDLGTVVGCSTWFPQPWRDRPAWRLRGMATAATVRGTGVGGRLLTAGLSAAERGGALHAWANARTVALGFYRHYGFSAVGPQFLTAQAIPHYLIWRALGPTAAAGPPAPGP